MLSTFDSHSKHKHLTGAQPYWSTLSGFHHTEPGVLKEMPAKGIPGKTGCLGASS